MDGGCLAMKLLVEKCPLTFIPALFLGFPVFRILGKALYSAWLRTKEEWEEEEDKASI
jgi:hypothetical protein